MSPRFYRIVAIVLFAGIMLILYPLWTGNGSNGWQALAFLILALFVVFVPRLAGWETFLKQRFWMFPVEREHVAEFYEYLARSVRLGQSLPEALTAHAQDLRPAWLRNRALMVGAMLNSGEPLWRAMAMYPAVFRASERQIIRTGEETERLPEALEFAASLLRAREIKNVPVFVLLLELFYVPFIVSFILIVIIPKFKDIYDQLGGELPMPTSILIDISYNLAHKFPWLVIGALIVMLLVSFDRRGNYARLLTKLPLLHRVYWRLPLSRFSYSLAAAMDAGLDPVRAASLAIDASANRILKSGERQLIDEIAAGRPFDEGVARMTRLPEDFLWYLRNSFESGNPGPVLLNLAERYRQAHERFVWKAGAAGMVLFTIIFGLISGFVLLALYLPLFYIPQTVAS